MTDPLSETDILIEKNQYEYAIFLLTDSIKNNVKKPEALIKRASCYMYMYRYRDAIKDLSKSIEINRTMGSAYIKQSKCYVAIGDLQNAINNMLFLRQLEQNNQFARWELEKLETLKELNKQAELLFEQKKYNQVVDVMDKCLEKAAICVRFKLIKAECLVYLEKHNEALDAVNEILFSNKDDLEAICIRALTFIHQEKYILGLTELREIMCKSPRAQIMYKNYKRLLDCLKQANIELENNELGEAERLYREALNLDQRNEHKNRLVLVKLARILMKRNKYDECIEMSSELIEYDPNNVKALEMRAKCNMELKEYDLAIEDYRTLLNLDPSNQQEIKRNLNAAEKKAEIEYNIYKILELEKRNITAAAIKKAYHKLAKQYHPDKTTTTSKYVEHKLNMKFSRINKAKDKLLLLHGS